jgi:hypothetical protein
MDESRGLSSTLTARIQFHASAIYTSLIPGLAPGQHETSSGSGREKHDLWSRKQCVGLARQPIGDEADPLLRGPVELDQS